VAQITITEAGNDLVGTFGKMKNPYSLADFELNKIRYYTSCDTATEADSTTFRNKKLNLVPGKFTDTTISVTQ
jgi:hypothetical protein